MGGITGEYFLSVRVCATAILLLCRVRVRGTKSCSRLAFILRLTTRAYSLRLGLVVTSGSDSPRGL